MTERASVGILPRLTISVPKGQRYSCQGCGSCCRWWPIDVTAAERNRLLAHDWASESPRLRGISLFEETKPRGGRQGKIQTAHIDGRCVFLEEDNRCLIHEVLGLEAKPAVCRRFPVRLAVRPEGLLAGADYACRAVVQNEGEPFAELVASVSEEFSEQGITLAHVSEIETLAALAPGIVMPWAAYLVVESALLDILTKPGHPVTMRLAAAGEFLAAMATDWSGRPLVDRDRAQEWLTRERIRDYSREFSAAEADHLAVTRPVAKLAPAIGGLESPHAHTSAIGSEAMGYAMAVAAETGSLYLSTLGETVDLRSAGGVTCDMDAPEFDGYLSRFLISYVMRKSLLQERDLKTGWKYLVTCFNLVQWYTRASAFLSNRGRAGLDDLTTGIQVVEKAYVP